MVVGSGLIGQDTGNGPPTGDNSADEDEGQILPNLSENFISSFSEDEDILQAGLGTMMDDRTDYLSDSRRRSYERWKRETLLRIDELEARDQANSMES